MTSPLSDQRTWNARIMTIGAMPDEALRTRMFEDIVDDLKSGKGPRECLPFALLSLTTSYLVTNEAIKAPLAFTQALRLYDDEPRLFDDQDRNWLMVGYRNMISLLIGAPQVPTEQIEQTLADMASRVAATGRGMSALRMSEFAWASHRNSEDMEERFRAWRTCPVDETSGCEWCNATIQADHLEFTDRRAESIALITATLARGPRCDTEPDDMLAQLALRYLRSGEHDKAVATYRRAYNCARRRDQPSHYSLKARSLFLAYTGNYALARTEVRHITDEIAAHPEPPIRLLDHLAALVRVTQTWVLDGHGADEVDYPGVFTGTVDDMHAWSVARALEVAGLFDARNHNTSFQDRVRSYTDEPPKIVPLSLAVTDPVDLVPDAVPGGSAGGAPGDVGPVGASGGDASPAARVDAPGELLTRASFTAQRDPARAASIYLDAARGFSAAQDWERAGFAYAEAGHLCEILGDETTAVRHYVNALELLERTQVPLRLRAPVAAAQVDSLRRSGDLGRAAQVARQWMDALAPLCADPAEYTAWDAATTSYIEVLVAQHQYVGAATTLDMLAKARETRGDRLGAVAAAHQIAVLELDHGGDRARARALLDYCWSTLGQLGQRDVHREIAATLIKVLREDGDESGAAEVLVQATGRGTR